MCLASYPLCIVGVATSLCMFSLNCVVICLFETRQGTIEWTDLKGLVCDDIHSWLPWI